MSNEPKLGQLIDAYAQRDAIHIAIAPMVAGEELRPGEPIGMMEPGNDTIAGSVAEPIGIVDPYLKKNVEIGERFYMFLYPQTITSLRHNWTHPAFKDQTGAPRDVAAKHSEEWLRNWFQANDAPDFADFMEAVQNGGEFISSDQYYNIRIDGDYVYVGGQDAHGSIPDEFWDHVETATGKRMYNRPTHFSCSC